MKLLLALKWPLTIIVSLALLIVGGVLLAGPSLGVSDETQAAVLTWVAGVGTLLAAPLTWLFAYLRRDSDGDGKPDWDDPAPRDPTNGRGAGGAGALVVAIAVSGSLASGCGASAITTQARAALVTTASIHVGSAAVTEARSAALDRVEREHPTDPEHDQALLEEAARWRPVGQAFDAAREAVLAWHDALELARVAGDDELALTSVLPLARRVLVLYARAAALARELDVGLPELPDWILALFPGGGGAS